ncbi:MAG TPA: hypothetical protein VNW15_03405 [Rhizomicrobium sp.]|jgi:hypothetical protein|nr:hypothetical protein [Rhizomicrobium sp.]
MIRFLYRLALAIVLIGAQCASAQSPSALPDGYAVYKSVALSNTLNGVTGSLQILTDSRVTPEIRGTMWGTGPADFAFYGSDLAKKFNQQPLLPGHLRIVDAAGQVVADEPFDRPLADIETTYLYGDNFPTYLVAVDYSSGCCNSGPATMMMEVRGGKLRHVVTGPFSSFLPRSVRADWHIVDAQNGKSKEIEMIDSNAGGPDADFVTEYWTYRFDGSQWVGKKRTEKGYWEADGTWPDRKKFP